MLLGKRSEDEGKEVCGINIELRSQTEEDVLSLREESGTRIQLSLQMQASAAETCKTCLSGRIYIPTTCVA